MATMEYKCPNCAGPLSFNPDKQKFSCPFCESDFDPKYIQDLYAEREKTETSDEREVNAYEERQKNRQEGDSEEYPVSYSCPSCGAEVVTTASTAATRCFYCQNPVVLGGRLSGEFKPDRVVPFTISKDKAVEIFLKMCGKKKFLPAGFTGKDQIEKMQGVYFPYWYVDEDLSGSISATGKKERSWTTGNRRYTETSTYRLLRTGDMKIKNVFERALKSNSREMLQSVHPFDLTKAQPFAMSYLSGFSAEKRDLEKKDVAAEIDKRMEEYAKQLLIDTMNGYQGISTEHFEDKVKDQNWNYTLLPVWIVTYKYKGEILPYAINGQTGKIYGSLPVAMGKLTAWAAVIAAIVIAICILGGMFFA